MKVDLKKIAVANILKLCAIFIMPIIMVACSSSIEKMDSSNYRKKLKIKHLNSSFYSAEYVGVGAGTAACFPPINNILCKRFDIVDLEHLPKDSESYKLIKDKIGKPIYKVISKLEMEKYEIEVSSPGPLDSTFVENMIFLAAADIAIQLGYPFMTNTLMTSVDKCTSIYSTSTYGVLNDNVYSGRTSLNEKIRCHLIEARDFIFFKKKSDIKSGVFYRMYKGGVLYPEEDLYVGTTPLILPKYYADKESGYVRMSITNAWQKVYDTSGLSRDLRKKYNISNNKPYILNVSKNETAKNKNKTDPLEINMVPME